MSLLYANWLKKRVDFTLRNFTPKLWTLERLHGSKLPVRQMKAGQSKSLCFQPQWFSDGCRISTLIWLYLTKWACVRSDSYWKVNSFAILLLPRVGSLYEKQNWAVGKGQTLLKKLRLRGLRLSPSTRVSGNAELQHIPTVFQSPGYTNPTRDKALCVLELPLTLAPRSTESSCKKALFW